nr:hypothetical protein CFP56_25766 [Quercus suber]
MLPSIFQADGKVRLYVIVTFSFAVCFVLHTHSLDFSHCFFVSFNLCDLDVTFSSAHPFLWLVTSAGRSSMNVMFSISTIPALLFPTLVLLPLVAGRAVWTPESSTQVETSLMIASLLSRDTSTCGGDAGLSQCDSSFPSDFCCPTTSTCLALNATSSVVAAICCPQGQQCTLISPVICDPTQQNATVVPNSGLHSDPTQTLDTCGTGCCPMGYSCKDGQCLMQAIADETASNSSAATSTATDSPASSTSDTAAASSAVSLPVGSPQSETDHAGNKFSGTSFAAGFVPGIALGAILVVCILLVLLHKKRKSSSGEFDEKTSKHDTLTDLGPLSRRPTYHGRSISEPAIDPQASWRTDFLRTSPPRLAGLHETDEDNDADLHGSTAKQSPTAVRTPKIKALFSHSPFLASSTSPRSTQAPMPAHLKRGTLSFNISPIRALKKQKSMHSLRRQMTDASRRGPSRASRSASQETIQVLMSDAESYTPDQRAYGVAAPASSTTTGGSVLAAAAAGTSPPSPSSTYPRYYSTPTRAPGAAAAAAASRSGTHLGTPYSPSTFPAHVMNNHNNNNGGGGRVTDVLVAPDGLRVVREPQKRDTTFSAMMERAGLRKSELLMGHGR